MTQLVAHLMLMPGAVFFDSSQQGGGRLFPISQMCKTKAQCVSGLMSLPRGALCSGSLFPGQSPDGTEILSSSAPAICFKAIMFFERISQTRSPLVRNKLRVKRDQHTWKCLHKANHDSCQEGACSSAVVTLTLLFATLFGKHSCASALGCLEALG